MTYVALLRGINVGGNSKVEMKRLKAVFEQAGMTDVKTYINSGNIIFKAVLKDRKKIVATIEKGIEQEFGFFVPTVIRTKEEIAAVNKALPKDWKNDQTMKCDVMFLWDEIDSPKVLEQLELKPDIDDDVKYVPGAILWRLDRDQVTRSGMMKLAGTKLYKQMTIRNCNTVRKLVELMEAVDAS